MVMSITIIFLKILCKSIFNDLLKLHFVQLLKIQHNYSANFKKENEKKEECFNSHGSTSTYQKSGIKEM
jgi:hypothetical protein